MLQIQVMKDDNDAYKDSPYLTSTRGRTPPLVTSNFVVQDDGRWSFIYHPLIHESICNKCCWLFLIMIYPLWNIQLFKLAINLLTIYPLKSHNVSKLVHSSCYKLIKAPDLQYSLKAYGYKKKNMEFIHFSLLDAVPFIQKFILILLTVDTYFKTEKYSTVHNPIW